MLSHRTLISRFRCGCHGLHVDTSSFNKDSEHRSREARSRLVCMSGSVEDKHHFMCNCPAYSHLGQQYSHLFHQASPSVAAFLATDHPNVVGSYLKTCTICSGPPKLSVADWWAKQFYAIFVGFATFQKKRRQLIFICISGLLAWLLNFAELD